MTIGQLKKELSKYKNSQTVKILDSGGISVDVYQVYSPSDYDDCEDDEEDKDIVFLEM